MKWSCRAPRVGFVLYTFSLGALVSAHAQAEWPPPESATAQDMMDPANWPNDPDYGYSYDEDRKGQWNYYSFLPEPNEVRTGETASGMSVDLAWRFTTGHPSVMVAITDSGMEWEHPDLLEAAFINHRELQAHRPALADGSVCGDLDPEYYLHPADTAEVLAGFDCNGDGLLTIADYANTPSLLPEAAEGLLKGDRNRNGVLDAEDLILNYSDGIDDDANGYIDDISGWDFFKDDNDAYDDTRYGHGTGEARDGLSRANNGIGEAGGCNQCRMLQLRVADSFVADSNDFAQAAIYATDMRAKVIVSALGAFNFSQYAQSALDYAYANGVLTVASMADENSRHQNQPTPNNHILPVHAIQYGTNNIFRADSFVDFHPCSNYGGQNLLSASGNSCSSEAVGQLGGISGLLFSAARKYGVDLTPGEATNLLLMTTDDIDVAESREPGSAYRWSHKGFDQRFGYGRVNANNAVEWIKDKKIPPAIDVTSPTWFTPLYADRVEGPVDIVGTISAKRANSYDYLVEWAPGVQPLDEDFETIVQEKNVAPDVVMGASEPLASLDIRDIDPTHDPDADSLLGENKYTITVRIRAVAHYGGSIGDVPGQMRRTYYVVSDPDLVKGFPIFLGSSMEAGTKMADIDGDGRRELVVGTAAGELVVLRLGPDGPEPLEGFPYQARRVDGLETPPPVSTLPSYLSAAAYASGDVETANAGEALLASAPAIADLDGDGAMEIVITSMSGTIYVVEADGTDRDGFPLRLPEVPSCPRDPDVTADGPCMSEATRWARGAFAAPVLEDMDADGDLDIIQAAFDGNVYVFDGDGELLDGWPVAIHYDGPFGGDEPPHDRVFTTPAVADFDGDGLPELLVGSNEVLGEGDGSGAIYLIDGRGTNAPSPIVPSWPITMLSLDLLPTVGEGIPNSGVVGRFGGTQAAVMHGNATTPLILPMDTGGQEKLNREPPNRLPVRDDGRGIEPSSNFGPLTTAFQPNTMLPIFSQPSLGDMDQDGTPDIVSSGGSLTLAQSILTSGAVAQPGQNLLSMWSGATGGMLLASPMVIEDYSFFSSSTIVDLSGDGYPEALIGTGGFYLHALDACGREAEGWPKFTGHWITAAPSVGDMDGDGTLEVGLGTRNGWLFAWHSKGTTDSVIEWESYHHDNRNTGNVDVPLEQGGPSKATGPLTREMCAAPTEATTQDYAVSGGCGCRIAGATTSDGTTTGDREPMALALLGLLLAAHRRQRGRRQQGRRQQGCC